MQNTQNELIHSKEASPKERATIALSLLLHGEAVRFNRGNKSGPNNYDFKHMIDWKNDVIPYVSSQSFKKNWRETLPLVDSDFVASEITIPLSKTEGKSNHVYTSGDPMQYVDDDLFGYMIAGASNTEDAAKTDSEAKGSVGPDDQDAQLAEITFSPELIKADTSWVKALKKTDDKLAVYLVKQFDVEAREEFDALGDKDKLIEDLRKPLSDALNKALEDNTIFDAEHFGKTSAKSPVPKLAADDSQALKSTDAVQLKQAKFKMLNTKFKSGFVVPANRKTTRRTAPIRMHAPIAFCGIKLAKDFQTFSRHIASTGDNSVLNPNAVGIYSGWLKTRVLIEAFRVGKFYIGENMDILEEQAEGHTIQEETNPYVREKQLVKYIQIPDDERKKRVGTALVSLGDIGSAHGPASGALHDGSLRPKAFIGAAMSCADSPFDNVWDDVNGAPRLNFARLKAVLRDWDDLFLDKTIYIGISPQLVGDSDVEAFALTVQENLEQIGFKAFVDTPRRAFKQMAKQIAI